MWCPFGVPSRYGAGGLQSETMETRTEPGRRFDLRIIADAAWNLQAFLERRKGDLWAFFGPAFLVVTWKNGWVSGFRSSLPKHIRLYEISRKLRFFSSIIPNNPLNGQLR